MVNRVILLFGFRNTFLKMWKLLLRQMGSQNLWNISINLIAKK